VNHPLIFDDPWPWISPTLPNGVRTDQLGKFRENRDIFGHFACTCGPQLCEMAVGDGFVQMTEFGEFVGIFVGWVIFIFS